MKATVHQSPRRFVDYTPVPAVAAGEVVLLGNKVCVCVTAIAAGQLGALAIDGVFKVEKSVASFAAGADVYWDADGSPVGGTANSGAASTAALATSSGEGAGSGVYMGWTPEAAGASATHVYVALNQPVP